VCGNTTDIRGGRRATHSTTTTDTTVPQDQQHRNHATAASATPDITTTQQTPSAPSSSGSPASSPPRADQRWNEEVLRQKEDLQCQLRRPQEWAARQEAMQADQAGTVQEGVANDGVGSTSRGGFTRRSSLERVPSSNGGERSADEDQIQVVRKDV